MPSVPEVQGALLRTPPHTRTQFTKHRKAVDAPCAVLSSAATANPSPRTTYLTMPVTPARSVEWSPSLWALYHAQAPTARCVQQALSKTIFKIQVDGIKPSNFENSSFKPCLILKGQTTPAQAPIVAGHVPFYPAPPKPAPDPMPAAPQCGRPRPVDRSSFAVSHAPLPLR